MSTEIKLPSRYQIGDKVSIKISSMFVVESAEIIKIHFSESKVTYDLLVRLDIFKDEAESSFTRIYNVDSAMF